MNRAEVIASIQGEVSAEAYGGDRFARNYALERPVKGGQDDTALDRDFEPRVRASFARQRIMEMIGAIRIRVDPVVVEIALPYRIKLNQQHSFNHAGIVATIQSYLPR